MPSTTCLMSASQPAMGGEKLPRKWNGNFCFVMLGKEEGNDLVSLCLPPLGHIHRMNMNQCINQLGLP